MTKNLRQVYEDKDNLLDRFNQTLNPGIPVGISDHGVKPVTTFFDDSELGSPVVVKDDLAKKWLEINYLFSTGFKPNARPGVGEMGADIRNVRPNGQKDLTTHLGSLIHVIKALNDFRPVEDTYAEWIEKHEEYNAEILRLSMRVGRSSVYHPELEKFGEIFGDLEGHIGFQNTGLPSDEFVKGLGKLNETLRGLSNKTEDTGELEQTASRLSKELAKYSAAIPTLAEIRQYHKTFPRISVDGMIRINSPAASGGLCMHTHPGHDDSYEALPSLNDLCLIAAQCDTIGISHIGGGETQGEHYIMHIPKKIFFDEVRNKVDQENVTDETRITQIKDKVLQQRLDDIMADEILGFKVHKKDGERIAILSPIVAEREYQKHREHLESQGYTGEQFQATGILLEVPQGYGIYDTETKNRLIQGMSMITESSK